MSTNQWALPALQRRMQIEAGAWGALVALNTAFVSLLLISRGAGAPELAIYASGASLFGLGAGLLGARAAAHVGSAFRVTLAALVLARSVFLAVPLLLAITTEGAIPLLIGALLLWSAGEGIALPLWTSYLAGLSEPAERSRWLAARATAAAAGAACAILPMLLLARLVSTERSLQAAYVVAALAAVLSTWQVRMLMRVAPAATPHHSATGEEPAGPGLWFLGGLFAFWFGAALNRPVLPTYVIHELQAPAAYFATAAVVAAISGAGIQRWWGDYGSVRGARPLLGLSGIGAGLAPLLWTVVPDYRFGVPLEAVAAGFWLGHLLGLTLYAVERAQNDAHRANLIARMQITQGAAATLAPLLAAAIAGMVGTIPILFASGLICLGATAVMADVVRPPFPVHTSIRYVINTRDRTLSGRILSGTVIAAPVAPAAGTATMLPARAPSRREDRVRTRLPVALKRALSADCPSCRGLGCGMCYGTGLG